MLSPAARSSSGTLDSERFGLLKNYPLISGENADVDESIVKSAQKNASLF